MSDHYEFSRRIKTLIANENMMLQKEIELSKESVAKEEELRKLYEKCFYLNKSIHSYRVRTKKLADCINDLKQFVHKEEQRMKEQGESNESLKEDVQEVIKMKELQRQKMIAFANKQRMMKEATGVFINPYELPGLLQGVKLFEKSDSTQLVPFRIDPMQLSKQELQDYIWNPSESEIPNSCEWNSLFLEEFDSAQLNEHLQTQ